MAGHSYSYYANMARRPDVVHGLTWAYGDEDDGCTRIHIRGSNTLRCPGVALRFSAVIDRTPAEDRMPPMTIDFVKNELDGASRSNAPPTLVAWFTRDTGDFILIRRTWDVEAMVAAAGFPPECALIVEDFFSQSASHAANTFWSGVAITVEMAPAGSHIDDDRSDEEEEDDEVGEECPICLKELVVGSAAAVQLSCSHAFHPTCLDKWVSKKRTCPYCRSPVLQGFEILLYEDYPELEEDDDSGEEHPRSMVLDGQSLSLSLTNAAG